MESITKTAIWSNMNPHIHKSTHALPSHSIVTGIRQNKKVAEETRNSKANMNSSQLWIRNNSLIRNHL